MSGRPCTTAASIQAIYADLASRKRLVVDELAGAPFPGPAGIAASLDAIGKGRHGGFEFISTSFSRNLRGLHVSKAPCAW